ncbi:MAG TPA: translocation/assembly module TamB domain-containing protein [Kofleriaceae bacterium]|nr:translocation/assembly module TamB domain-containing protein [Kofleriaceae bacterium]
MRRRPWRWIRRGLLVLGALLASAVIAALVVVHTDWGRDLIRRKVVAALQESFPGCIKIGRIDGSVLANLDVHDLVLCDASGREAVTVKHVRVNVGLLALLRGEIDLQTLDADGVKVLAIARKGQPLNLATIHKASPGPSTWDLALPRVRVRDLDVTVDRDGQVDHLDDLGIDASAYIPADGPLEAQVSLTGRARERDAALALDAEAWSDDGGVVVPDAHLALGDATIDVDAASYRKATPEAAGAIHGAVAVRAPAGVLPQVAPELGVSAAIDLWAAAALAVRPDRPGLGVVDGDVIFHGKGAAADLVLDRIDATVAVAGGVARLVATAAGDGGTEALARARATLAGGVLDLRDVHVDATVPSLAAASHQTLGVDGAVKVAVDGSARVGGEQTSLTVRAQARATRLRKDALRVGLATIDVSASGEPRKIAGEVKVAVTDARNGPQLLPDATLTVRGGVSGPLDIDLDARSRTWKANGRIGAHVQLAPPGDERLLATIDLGDYHLDLPRGKVNGRGGRVTLERDATIVHDVHMRVAGASLAVDATAGRGKRAGQLDAKIDLTELDLSRLRGVPGLPPALGGTVALKTDLHRRGHAIRGEVDGRVRGLVAHAGAIPVDLDVTAAVAPHSLRLGVSGQGRELGSFSAIANVAAPARIDDVAAWTRLDRAAVRELKVRARALDLARLSQLTGTPPSAEGMLDADVALDPQQGSFDLHGRGLVMAGAPAPLDVDVAVDLADPTLAKVTAHGALRDLGEATVTTAVALPPLPFDPAAWRRTDLRALHAIDLTIHRIDLDESRAERLGLHGIQGRVAGTVHVEPGLGPITAHLAANDLIAGPLVRPALVTLDTDVQQAGSKAVLCIALDGQKVLEGQVTLPYGLARLLAHDVNVAAVPLTGTLTVGETPIAVVTRAIGQDPRLGGTVHGTIDVGGTVAAPEGSVALEIDDLGARVRRPGAPGAPVRQPRSLVRQLVIDATYKGGAVHGEVQGHAADGGQLAVVADLDPASLASAHASVKANHFQLGPVTRLAPKALLGVRGVLDADLQVTGVDPGRARAEGTLRITGAQAPIADSVGALRDGTVDLTVRGGDLRATIKGDIESGHVDATATAQLTGLLPDDAKLDATVRGLQLITTSAPRIDGAVHAEVVRDADIWRGVVRIHDTSVDVPKKEGRQLLPASLPADMVFTSNLNTSDVTPRTSATALSGWIGVRPTRPFVDLQVVVSPVTVVAEQLRGEVGGRMHLQIGGDGASLEGRVGVIRGKVLLFDRRYIVRRADLAFDGGIDPLLDIQLEYDFPQLTMRVNLRGRLSKPELTLSSDPNTYDEGQLLAILVGGSPGSPNDQSNRSVTDVATSAAAELVGSYFVHKLPVRLDVVNYESVTADASSALVVGRWITSETLLLLRTRIDPRPDENNNEAEIETWLTGKLMFQGSGGDRGVLGADLLWNKRW